MASASIKFNINNAETKRLIKKLQLLGPKLENKSVRQASSKAIKPISTDARRNARKSKRTGWLSKNIGMKQKQYKSGVTITMVGPSNKKDPRTGENPANIGHLIEFPVKPHLIVPESKGLFGRNTAAGLSNKRDVDLKIAQNLEFFGEEVQHPGFQGRPFMQPAFDSKVKQTEKIYTDELRKAVVREAINL